MSVCNECVICLHAHLRKTPAGGCRAFYAAGIYHYSHSRNVYEKIAKICEALGPKAARLYMELLSRGGCAKLDAIEMSRTAKYIAVRKLIAIGAVYKNGDLICVV